MKTFEKRREVFHSHEPGYMALDIRGSACDLLALFLADEPVHKLVSKYAFNGISQEYSEYREDRIVKLLIEIATSYRLTSWRLKGKMREIEMGKEVGSLFLGDDDAGRAKGVRLLFVDDFA